MHRCIVFIWRSFCRSMYIVINGLYTRPCREGRLLCFFMKYQVQSYVPKRPPPPPPPPLVCCPQLPRILRGPIWQMAARSIEPQDRTVFPTPKSAACAGRGRERVSRNFIFSLKRLINHFQFGFKYSWMLLPLRQWFCLIDRFSRSVWLTMLSYRIMAINIIVYVSGMSLTYECGVVLFART